MGAHIYTPIRRGYHEGSGKKWYLKINFYLPSPAMISLLVCASFLNNFWHLSPTVLKPKRQGSTHPETDLKPVLLELVSRHQIGVNPGPVTKFVIEMRQDGHG